MFNNLEKLYMYTCSITCLPLNQNPYAVLIPILVRKEYKDSSVANVNVRPFPISVCGMFDEETFHVDLKDKERENFMMNMISNVLGRHVTWKEFQNLRGSEKNVEYDGNDYVLIHRGFGLFFLFSLFFN